jgi:hypothetical protein
LNAFRETVTKDFDVLITDLHMESTQKGRRLVTAIRDLQPEVLIIAVSDSLEADVIVKPFAVQDVAELVRCRTLRGFNR